MRAVYEGAELAGVDEQRLTTTVTEPTAGLGARHEPQAHGDRRRVEKLARQGDDAIYQVCLNDGPPNFPFTRLVRGEGAVRHNEASDAGGVQVVYEVLYP